MLKHTLFRLLAIATFTIGLFALSPITTASAQACKGLSKSACGRNNSCSYVNGYTRSDGVKVKSFCRSKPGSATKASAKKSSTKKTTKKKSTTKKNTTAKKTSTSKTVKAKKKPKTAPKKTASKTKTSSKKKTTRKKTTKKKKTATAGS